MSQESVARVPSLSLTTGCSLQVPRGDLTVSRPCARGCPGSDISMHIFKAGRIIGQKEHLKKRFSWSKNRDSKIFRHA